MAHVAGICLTKVTKFMDSGANQSNMKTSCSLAEPAAMKHVSLSMRLKLEAMIIRFNGIEMK